MKVALACSGPIRTFNSCYQTWVDNIIVPLENVIGKGNVKIFMYNSVIDEDFYKTNIENSLFNQKIGIDSSGWKDIIEKSPYIEKYIQYTYNNQYIEDIFTKINKANNTNYDPYSLKKYEVPAKKKGKKFYPHLITAITLNYNNKKIIDVIPNEYDIIIKIRPDAYLMKPYPIDKILNMKKNTIYLQNKISPFYTKYKNHKNRQSIFKKLGKTYYPIPKLHKKNFLLGKRWDNFYMGTRSTLVQLYDNYFYYCHTILNKFIQLPNRQNQCEAEYMLKDMIVKEKIKAADYLYHGAADKVFSKIGKNQHSWIKLAEKNNINWFVLKNDHQHLVNFQNPKVMGK